MAFQRPPIPPPPPHAIPAIHPPRLDLHSLKNLPLATPPLKSSTLNLTIAVVGAVRVDVDYLCGSARTSFCEVAGVELTTAPKRPANSKTVVTRLTWLPYGLRTSQDTSRAEYAAKIGGLLKAVLLPHLQSMENPAAHLNKVIAIFVSHLS
jgi:hypothetical protein